jgi:hypothetical protein
MRNIFTSRLSLAAILFLAVALVASPSGQAIDQAAPETFLYDEMNEQFTIELPGGWSAHDRTGSMADSYGVTVFSSVDLGDVPSDDGESLFAETASMLGHVERGKLPSFTVDRHPAMKGMSCGGIGEKCRKKHLKAFTSSQTLGKGAKLVEAPHVASASLAGCEGFKVRVRSHSRDGEADLREGAVDSETGAGGLGPGRLTGLRRTASSPASAESVRGSITRPSRRE